MNYDLGWSEDLVQEFHFRVLHPSRSLGRYLFTTFFLENSVGDIYVLAIELSRLSSNWSLLCSCNPHLMCLVSPPSEIHLVLDILNSLSLFN